MPGQDNARLDGAGAIDQDPGNGISASRSLPNLPGYVVLLITRYGMPRRKVYLDLGHARAAVQRANDKHQQARLVLCELRAVRADLDGDVTS